MIPGLLLKWYGRYGRYGRKGRHGRYGRYGRSHLKYMSMSVD